jgi:3-oxoacyl-(acyl-carrier-protein) synthase
MAKLLRDKGVHVHPTTVAKIEAGERAAKIDEIAAIADIFEISVDMLLGRSAAPKNDDMYALRALMDTAQQASWQAQTIENTLRERIAEVTTSEGPGKTIAAECERAADALAEAHTVLYETLNPSGSGTVARFTRKMLIEALQREEDDNAT